MRMIRLFLLLAMLAAGGSASAQTTTSDLAQTADQLDRLAGMLDAARGILPRTTFDPAAVVAEVGTDPQALAEWVATQTALVPYRGRLRGAIGVLMDRYGNSLDRSLLLAALLQAAGHEPVLVHGTLNETDASRLVEALPRLPAPGSDGPTRDALLAELGFDPASAPSELNALLDGGDRAASEVRDDLAARTREQGDALLALVAEAAAPVAGRTAEIEALRDHWWIRLEAADGAQDLDPSGARDGAAEIETVAVSALAAELSHRVELTVAAEFLARDGVLSSEPLLSHVLTPADLAGVPIVLWQEPIDGPTAAEIMAASDPAAVERMLLDQRSWQPVLRIGDGTFTDRLVTIDGSTRAGDILTAGTAFQGARPGEMADVLGDFGAFLDDAGAAGTAAPAGDLVALWLEFRIAGPGLATIVHRRAVFDLIGAAMRASGGPIRLDLDAGARRARIEALLAQVDIGVWGATPSTAFVADVVARDMAPLFAAVAGQLRRDPAAPADLVELQDLPRSQILAYSFAAGRAGLAGEAPLVIDRPNVLLLHLGTRFASESGPATTYAMIDIVENGVGQVAAPAAGAFAARLRQGVADTALESTLLGAPDPSRNASALFATDLAAGREWVTLTRPEDLGQVDLPGDVAAQIAAALDDGYLAVAPRVVSPAGIVAWWRIDAETGTTLGMGATGAGSEFVEYLAIVGKVIGLAGCAVGTYDAMQNVSTGAGAAATGAAAAVCVMGLSISMVGNMANILFVTSPMTAAAAGANAAAWLAPTVIGEVAAAGGGLILGILGL